MLAFFAVSLFCTSCTDFNHLAITISDLQASDTFTIAADTNDDYMVADVISDTFKSYYFREQIESQGYNYRPEKLTELKITDINVDLISPETGNMSVIGNAAIWIYSAHHPEYVKIGYVLSDTTRNKNLRFDLTDIDIAPQLKDDWYQFYIHYDFTRTLLVKHKFAANFTYSLKMEP